MVPPADYDLDSAEDNSLVESMSGHTWPVLVKDESQQTSSAPIVASICCPLQGQAPATAPSIEMQQSSFAYTVDESMLLTPLSVDTLSCDETRASTWHQMRPTFLRHLENALDWTLEETSLCFNEGCNAPWTEPPSSSTDSSGIPLQPLRGLPSQLPMTSRGQAMTEPAAPAPAPAPAPARALPTTTRTCSASVLQKSASTSSSFSEFSQVDWVATAYV